MSKLAVLDIGTNSIHMVLAEVEPDFSYKILDCYKDVTRLGAARSRPTACLMSPCAGA